MVVTVNVATDDSVATTIIEQTDPKIGMILFKNRDFEDVKIKQKEI